MEIHISNKKGFLQISFAWLFALIVGAAILFLAIYMSVKIVGNEQTVSSAKTGKEIGILTNPLETGFETGKTSSLTMPINTRIYNKCGTVGLFGKQIIEVSQENFGKWSETNIDISFSNKYIFSENPVEGKKFYVFAKPFEFPFKVSDLIYMTSSDKNYCFEGSIPLDIENEINNLNPGNFFTSNCPASGNSVEICFGSSSGSDCDVTVNYLSRYVETAQGRVYFETDALMYAAIFSNPETYECQVERLMKRVEHLALLYQSKAAFVSKVGCNTNLNLAALSNAAENFIDSSQLSAIKSISDEIYDKNEVLACRLW